MGLLHAFRRRRPAEHRRLITDQVAEIETQILQNSTSRFSFFENAEFFGESMDATLRHGERDTESDRDLVDRRGLADAGATRDRVRGRRGCERPG